ncbi:MAG: hypothetical protein JXA16_12650 [Bacteroidales bacterium]|nr:hypothetical protein [Bacteroidales bacterium]
MKTTFAIIIALFIALPAMSSDCIYNFQKQETLIATYKGMNDDGKFVFTDDDGNEFVFDEVSENVNVNLYDDEIIGTKFSVTWEEDFVDIFDEEGEATGETQKISVITDLKEI